MKQAWIKAMVGKLAAMATLLLFLVVVPAAAAGTLPVWAAVLLVLGGIVLLNAACGVALPEEEKTSRTETAPGVQPVQLRVVRGGRAA